LIIVLHLGFDGRVTTLVVGLEITWQFGEMAGKRLSERGLCCEMMSAEPAFTSLMGWSDFMRSSVVLSYLGLLLAINLSSASAAEPSAADQMAAAVESWRIGDLDEAHEQLTQMIETGSRDARVYYYRAVISEQLGSDAEQDLKTAARLEAETTSTRLVNRALENVQGETRAKIEKYRSEARAKLKPDPKAEAGKALYREGIEAWKAHDGETALARFDAVIKDGGTDARVYYLRGVVLAEMGRTDDAKLAFADGLSYEKTAKEVQLVNLALTDVQGGIRQMIEEQTTVEINGRIVSRQAAHRIIQRLDSMSQAERLTEAGAAAAREAEREQAAAEARQQKAAEAIIAENKATADAEARVNAPGTPAADLLAAADAPKKATIPAATPKADAPPTAEASETPASSNPFLGGKPAVPGSSASRATGEPINTSYLPADADFVVYVRPADVLASGFLAPLKGTPEFEKVMNEMAAQTGFDANDIESVTSGVSNFMAGMMQLGVLAASGQDPTAMAQNLFGGGNAISVLRTNKDLELATIIATSKGVESNFDGKPYYLIDSQQPNQPQVAMYAVDARTYVFGVEKAIQTAITNDTGEATNEQFSFVSNGSPFVLAFSSPLLAGMSGSIPDAPGEAPPMLNQIVQAVRGKIAGAAITMNFASNLDLKVVVNLTEPEAATEVQGPLDQGLGMAKQMYPLAGAQMVPQPLQAPVNQMVSSLAASHSGSVATISLTIPGQIVSILKDNPEIIQGAMPAGPGAPGILQPPPM